jgi:chromosomal replication initiator protein
LVTAVHDLWKRAGEILRSQVSDGVWHSTFAHVEPQDRHDGELWLEVPNAIVRDKLDGRYRPLVEDAINEVDPTITAVVIRVVESALLAPPPTEDVPTLFDDRGEPSSDATHHGDELDLPTAERTTRYTFDAFVIGQSNRFAHAAALSVAERPGGSYNPLFIYGGAGLGKTHLLRAIEAYVNEVYPQLKVQYVSTETFLNEFVDSIRTTTGNEFKRRYRQIDVLLVDDIQFIAGRDGLQEEFFHTFNDLYGANRQIVLSSDRQPDAIPTLEDRLRSRFMMGLITDIQPPDLETRMAILRKKADRDGYLLPNDVSEFIASNITNNIRELEGALNRVTAYSNLNRQPLTCELAERVLADLIADRQPRPITPAVILESTAEMYGFTVEDLKSKSRRRPLVIARQVSMYLTRELTDLSYPAIAREFGGRDHTTVMHACDKISALMKERSQIYDQVTALDKAIRNRG